MKKFALFLISLRPISALMQEVSTQGRASNYPNDLRTLVDQPFDSLDERTQNVLSQLGINNLTSPKEREKRYFTGFLTFIAIMNMSELKLKPFLIFCLKMSPCILRLKCNSMHTFSTT